MFIDSGKITSTWGKEPPVMTSKEELKIELAREEWKKLIAQGWRRTEEVWTENLNLHLILKIKGLHIADILCVRFFSLDSRFRS